MSGFEQPNYTQTPNTFFDKVMPEIDTVAELKVTLCVIRQTFGYHKTEDQLSLSRIMALTGLRRESVVDGTKRALKRGTITRKKVGQSYSYRAKVVGKPDHLGAESSRQTGPLTSRQTGPTKETEKESYSRRDADASPEEEKTNWFTVLCSRFNENGIPIAPEDRDRLPGNLVSCVMKEKASDQEMHRVIGRIVSRRLEKAVISPQVALGDIRGNGSSGKSEPTGPMGRRNLNEEFGA